MKTIIKNPNCWRMCTTSKRCRTLKSVFAVMALLSLLSGLTADDCNSDECLGTALAVLEKMNPDIDPCDDFYEFACGAYMKKTKIPEDKEFVNVMSELSEKVQEQLEFIIKERRPKKDPKHLRLPNDLYEACMNTAFIETLGPKPIQQIAKEIGGWPVLDCDCWDKDDSWTWQETIKNFRRLGFPFSYIVGFSIQKDPNNPNKHIINLDQYSSSIGLKLSAPTYYRFMVDTAVLFGADEETAITDLRKSLQFEMDLASISWSDEQRKNSTNLNNLRSIKQMQESYPYVQWLDYINALLPEGVTVKEDEVINVSVPSFFAELGNLINRTNKRDIANYLMWSIHQFSLQYLSGIFHYRQLQYNAEMLGAHTHETRPSQCTRIVLESLATPVHSLYVRKYFHQDSKTNAIEMANNIRNAFDKILDETQWMNTRTKQEAKKKLNLTTNFVGHHDELLDDDKLQKYYLKLDIDPVKYFKSVLRTNHFDTDNSFNELRLPVDAIDWMTLDRPAIVNAIHKNDWNAQYFPAGFLQGHFFNDHRPKYMNYGAIGYIMGHEFLHGFNEKGSKYDGNGNLLDWWQPEIRTAYKEKVQCVIYQYGNYTDKYTELNLNGSATQVENIADNGGIKAAYLAYKQWVAQNGEEAKLPGLNYTPEQMFWISAAQGWCAVNKNEYTKLQITDDSYAPNEFRVLGPFSNMEDFSRVFQCSNGTRMNPVKKCKVW